MAVRDEVREFLVSRRSKVSPQQVGYPPGGDRRVTGLRRGEVAALAGVSVEYYAKVERGQIAGASDIVLNRIADVLGLDSAERAHLFNLRAAASRTGSASSPRGTEPAGVRPAVQRMLDALDSTPAYVQNGRMDLVAWNAPGRALYSEAFLDTGDPPNLARFVYCHRDRAERFYPRWDDAADASAQIMRAAAGRNPHDRVLRDLITELSARSAEFRTRWARHDVRLHASGTKRFTHPVIGEIELSWELMDLPMDPDLKLVVFTAAPDSPAAGAVRLLAGRAATAAAPRLTTT